MSAYFGAFGALIVGLLLLPACSKSGNPVLDSREFYGVKVSLPKLDTDFANATGDAQASVGAIKLSYRYGRFPQALAELEALSSNPALTEPQKKLVKDLMDQTKQVIAKSGTPTGR